MPGTLEDALGQVLDAGRRGRLDRAALLVACFEQCTDFFPEVRNATQQGPDRTLQVDSVWRDLERAFGEPGTGGILVPNAFWDRLAAQLQGDANRGLLARACLGAADGAFLSRQRKPPPPRRVAESLFHALPYWVVPRAGREVLPWGDPADQRPSGRAAAFWLQRAAVIPARVGQGARLRVAMLEEESARALAEDDDGGRPSVTFAVSPISRCIDHECEPVGEITVRNTRLATYRLTGQTGIDRLAAIFRERILPCCRREGAEVLLLPELTVSSELRSRLAAELEASFRLGKREDPELPPRPWLVIAGSYHATEAGRTVNRCTVLDHRGRPAKLSLFEIPAEAEGAGDSGRTVDWCHDKVARFEIPGEAFAGLPDPERAAWLQRLGMDRPGIAGGAEPPDLGNVFTVVMTPRGRMALAICIDYLNICAGWRDEIQGGWLDWLWVPSATLRVSDFEHKARDLAIDGTGTVVVNACWFPEALRAWSGQWAGFVHLPLSAGSWLAGRYGDERATRHRQPAGPRPRRHRRGKQEGRLERSVPLPCPCGSKQGCTADGAEGCVFIYRL